MKRKKHKPISQAEQSKRFIEAAREAGVDESEGVLEKAIRKMVRTKQTKTFTASTEAKARSELERWKKSHPAATILIEHKPIVHTALQTVTPGRPKGPHDFVTIAIEYEE